MIERIIRSLGDVGMKTREQFYPLTVGEVVKAKFRDEQDYNKLLSLHIFELATEAELIDYQRSFIPVIPMESEAHVSVVETVEEESPVTPVVEETLAVLDAPVEKEFSTTPNKKSSRNLSRCPRCGRVKSKDAEFCKRCNAEVNEVHPQDEKE